MQTQKNRNSRSHGSKNAASALRSQAATLGEDMRELATTAGEVARHQLDPLETYVREQPMKALLIAAGIGAVLSMFFLRR